MSLTIAKVLEAKKIAERYAITTEGVMSWTSFNPPIVLIGKGTFICEKCKGPKKMLKSRVCSKPGCRTSGWRQMGHRIVEMNRAKRKEPIAPHVVCPECAADVPIPESGKAVCPRCRLEIS